jgi:hypothetical protein
MRKLIVGACIAATGAVALIPASASAATFDTKVTIEIKGTGNGFRGKVRSSNSDCVVNRKVTLQRRKAGQEKFRDIGSDNASTNGSWSVRTQPVNRAKYRAVVERKRIGADRCAGASSERTKAHKTSVTIVPRASDFIGQVFSSDSCVRHRTIHLQRKRPSADAFHTIGTDLTNNAGKWRVDKPAIHGSTYRARAEAKQVGAHTSCMRGTSPKFHG